MKVLNSSVTFDEFLKINKISYSKTNQGYMFFLIVMCTLIISILYFLKMEKYVDMIGYRYINNETILYSY